jgi:hypothetical protein
MESYELCRGSRKKNNGRSLRDGKITATSKYRGPFPFDYAQGQDWGQNLQQQQQQIPFGDDNQKDNCGRPERRLQARWLMLLQEDRPALLQEDRPTGPYIEALVNPS